MRHLIHKTTTTTALLFLAMQLFSQTFNIRFGRDESLGYAAICRSSCVYSDTIYTVFSEGRSEGGWNPVVYKIDLNGNRLDSLFAEYGVGQHIPGWADAAFVNDNGIYFGGYMLPYSDTVSSMGFICNYNFDLSLNWIKYFGDSINNHGLMQVKPTSDGGLIAIGSGVFEPAPKFYVVKTDGDGNIEWEKYLGMGDKYRNSTWITELANGDFLASGSEDRTEYNPCGIIFRLSPTGSLLQTKKYPFWGLIDNQGVSHPLELDNGDLVFGTVKYDVLIGSNTDYRRHPQLVKINGATLDTIWTSRIANTLYSGSTQVSQIAEDGNIVCVGTYDWHGGTVPYSLGIVSKVDTDGNLIWHRRHYHAAYGDNLLFDLDPLPNGGWLATGYTFLIANNGDPVTAKEAWLLALDEDGCLVPDCENLVYSVDEKNPIAFSVYPNPVQNDLNIALAHNMGNEEVLINVYDLQGRSVMQHQIQMNEGTLTLDASPLPSGTYFLSITVGGVTKTERLVRE
jgi:hypothetical protein